MLNNFNKLLLKVIALSLILGSISLGSLGIENNYVSAATDSVFYAHPSKAKEIGRTFTTSKKISRKELIDISDYFDDQKKNNTAALSTATTILVSPLNPYASVTAGSAVGLLTTYSKTHGDLVSEKLKKSTKKSFNVKIKYRYIQAGSNQGYYKIDKINIG